MKVHRICDPTTSIGEVLLSTGQDGILIEAENEKRFAILPLDEELLDYLIERDPKFIEECRRIRERMREGKFHRHEDVKKMIGDC